MGRQADRVKDTRPAEEGWFSSLDRRRRHVYVITVDTVPLVCPTPRSVAPSTASGIKTEAGVAVAALIELHFRCLLVELGRLTVTVTGEMGAS